MSTTAPATGFRVTPDAARQILGQAGEGGAACQALRVAARQEADGSVSYGMGFDDVGPDDEPLLFAGLAVLLSPGCEPLLEGTVLDFVEMAPGRFHFVFIPPTSAGACESPRRACGSGGCGSCG